MSAIDHAQALALNLERLVPAEPDRLALAAAAGVQPAELRAMLNAELVPCPRTMFRLALALKTSATALLSEPTS